MTDPTRVLYVEPEGQAAETAAAPLAETDGFRVATARGSEDGLQLLADRPIDCVVSEHTADFDGLDVLEVLRAEHPSVPFVLLAREGSEALATEAFRAGATDYVPADTAQHTARLADRIRAVVDPSGSSQTETDTDTDIAARYEALFEHANDAIVLVEFDGETPVVQAANDVFASLFASEGTTDEVVGRDIDTVVATPDRQESARQITTRIQSGRTASDTVVRDTVDGPQEFHFQAVPIGEQRLDDAHRAFAIYTKITHAEHTKEELDRLRRE